MKKLKTELLNEYIYQDRGKKNPFTVSDDDKEPATCRDFIIYVLDLPVDVMSRKTSQQIDKIYDIIDSSKDELEDADHSFLMDKINKAGIKNKFIYDHVMAALNVE